MLIKKMRIMFMLVKIWIAYDDNNFVVDDDYLSYESD